MVRKKVSIIGAGKVGATLCQILAYKKICDIVLINRTADTAKGIVLDICESASIERFDVSITGSGDYSEISGSDLVVLTAGVPRKEGMSRDDLLSVNSEIVRSACAQVKKYAPNAILVVLTNPLDEMVYLAKIATGFPKQRVIGMAGILDTSRLKYFVASELGVSVNDVEAMVLGSHGDSMVPLMSSAKVAGSSIHDRLSKEKIDSLVQRTRNAGAEIIALEKDSSAYYAPASSLALIVESVILDSKAILPCSAYLEGEYGISGIFIGVPVAIGGEGIEKIVEVALGPDEKEALDMSAAKIASMVGKLK